MGQQQPTGVPAVGDAYDRTSVTLTYECLRPVNVGSSPGENVYTKHGRRVGRLAHGSVHVRLVWILTV